MDKPIRELVNASLLAAKAAVNTVNAKHLAIPHRPAYDRSNPGSIALAMIRESTHPSDPLSVIKHVGRIRAETKAAFVAAEKQLEAARAEAQMWMDVIDFLEGNRSSTGLGTRHPQVEAAARTVKTAVETGNIEPRDLTAVTQQMRRDRDEAIAAIDDGFEKLARIKSAGGVALAVEASKAYARRAEGNPMLLKMASHHSMISSMRKLEHGKNFYDEQQRRNGCLYRYIAE